MIKQLTGLTASLVALTSVVQAEVKINDYLSLDGYAIGTFGITEGTPAQNDTFLDSGDKMQDAAKVAVNGTYGDFKAKVSLFSVPNLDSGTGESGLLDAYVTYTTGAVSITGGKFNNYLGYESFDSPNNAFITFGPADNIGYVASYATGAKIDYVTEAFSVGFSARDSLLRDGFFKGDADYSDDIGYEAYVLFTGVEKLTVFIGGGYEDTDGAVSAVETYNIWAAYAVTDKFTLVGSWARTEDFVSFSYTIQGSYAVSDTLSVAARIGEADGEANLLGNGSTNYSEVGVASTYTFTPNFAVKGEVNKKDFTDGASDVFFYAVQGLFKF
jgi:Putative beta-barrel porin-2, OmpL-like. bbp2